MAKIITILTLIFVVLLFPPASLALISNNAIPGDDTYPIKRFIEDRIYDVLSLSPTSKAWFAAARSDRRFTEIKLLVNSRRGAKVTLRELVSQAETTVNEIVKVEDPIRKNQLLDQYKKTIEEYKKGLEEIKQQAISNENIIEPTSEPTPSPAFTPTPAEKPTITQAPAPRKTVTPTPTKKPKPTPASRPTPTPANPPAGSDPPVPIDPEDIDDAIDDLDDIGQNIDQHQDNNQENTPTPAPTNNPIQPIIKDKPPGDDVSPTDVPSLTPEVTPASPTPSVCPLPLKPSGLTYIDYSKTVSWDKAEGASYYNVRLVAPSSQQYNFDHVTNTWYTFPENLVATTGDYSWWVYAVNECGIDKEGSSFIIHE